MNTDNQSLATRNLNEVEVFNQNRQSSVDEEELVDGEAGLGGEERVAFLQGDDGAASGAGEAVEQRREQGEVADLGVRVDVGAVDGGRVEGKADLGLDADVGLDGGEVGLLDRVRRRAGVLGGVGCGEVRDLEP